MMAELNTDVRYIKGIGEKKALALNKLGVFSLYDLVSFFPRKYEDRTAFKPISLALDGETVCIRALVAETPRLSRVRRGLELVKLRAADEGGVMDLTFFNQPYVKDQLHRGESYVFYGRMEVSGMRRRMVNPVYEREGAEKGVTGRIVPIYRLRAGLSQRDLSQGIRRGLALCLDSLPELLPEPVRRSNRLAAVGYAYENIHFPRDFEALALARRRLIFEELFVLACALGRARGQRTRAGGIPIAGAELREFWASLPFSPTGAQRRAVAQAVSDLRSGSVMNRLVQGDVGSGKTLVALMAMLMAVDNGYQACMMAPTEILATQHYETLSSLLRPIGVRTELLTGSTRKKQREEIHEGLVSGDVKILVGTHALLEDTVVFSNLGFVVIDEQHRFGVEQRSRLWRKNSRPPHILVMTATPIPRTLAMTVYGDLDVSVIDELPPGRKPVTTIHRYDNRRAELYESIRRQIEQGRQVYIVYPLIQESEKIDLKNLEEGFKQIREVFPEYTVCMVHGKMKPAEKDAEMQRFVGGEAQIMVATTVIEVGVNVPNATVMVIENAERFGLSQLHQLRGRVGRGADQSYCVLVTSHKLSEDTRKRIEIMTRTNDGFEISEADLQLRGPGDMEGTQQSGIAFDLRIANIAKDGQILQLARDIAGEVLDADPDLAKSENAVLPRRLEKLFRRKIDFSLIS